VSPASSLATRADESTAPLVDKTKSGVLSFVLSLSKGLSKGREQVQKQTCSRFFWDHRPAHDVSAQEPLHAHYLVSTGESTVRLLT
jgi:hypothetical protein